jgi:hypothetical protein
MRGLGLFLGWVRRVTAASPHPLSDILMEDGFFILLEDGTSSILLE